MTLKDLTPEQKLQVKQNILTQKQDNVSWGELFNADELISDDELEQEYGSTKFVDDDFLSTENEMKEQTIYIGDNYCLKIENSQYSINYPTQVYLCKIDDGCAIRGRNFVKDTLLSTMIKWAENQIKKII